jgi:S1-C subfamily serine protease
MKHTLVFLLLFFIAVVPVSFAQQMVKMQFDEKTDFMFPELGTILHQGKDGITVTMAPKINMKAAENKNADLKEGDEIVVVNGSRPKDIKDLRKIYDGVAKGGEIKLGIKRDGKTMIVTVLKVGANPNMKMMTMNQGDVFGLPGIGIISDSGKIVKLIDMSPNPEEAQSSPLKIGDTFKQINGKNITSIKQFKSLYDKCKSGESVEMKIVREGTEQTLSIKKPEGKHQGMIKRVKP